MKPRGAAGQPAERSRRALFVSHAVDIRIRETDGENDGKLAVTVPYGKS